jgi:hypothetical protein
MEPVAKDRTPGVQDGLSLGQGLRIGDRGIASRPHQSLVTLPNGTGSRIPVAVPLRGDGR